MDTPPPHTHTVGRVIDTPVGRGLICAVFGQHLWQTIQKSMVVMFSKWHAWQSTCLVFFKCCFFSTNFERNDIKYYIEYFSR